MHEGDHGILDDHDHEHPHPDKSVAFKVIAALVVGILIGAFLMWKLTA